ncbi:MAG: endonuclease III [Chitinivibrionales bacterium]
MKRKTKTATPAAGNASAPQPSGDINAVLRRLGRRYPVPSMGLSFETPWQLLIATILSAQTTDTIVNQITPQLFARFGDPQSLACASQKEVEEMVRKSGTYRQKARNLRAAADSILRKNAGSIPQTMEELTALPGVGRKTANVVLSHGFKKPQGIIVDTHVLRVCYRLGLSLQKSPQKMEEELIGKIPQQQWGIFENRIKDHGQAICQSRRPRCEGCFLADICPKNDIR